MPNTSPRSAWNALVEGNRRFVDGRPEHPSQGVDHRASLIGGQHPTAILFGCSDSRVAAEIIFDQGLGDMFVVRTAGQVVDSAVLGSLEFGAEVLEAPLIVILGHDSCGAVKATINALEDGTVPGGFIRDIVERVTPSVLNAHRLGYTRADDVEARHVLETGKLLIDRSSILEKRVAAGKLAIVGLTYKLADGKVEFQGALGDIGPIEMGSSDRTDAGDLLTSSATASDTP
ncbi:MAG: carbonic anhydrase [Rhodococcus sp. (in: high G+C Gram-positive bacteria)]